MRTSTLRKYTCSNSSSGVISGRPRDRVLATVGRSRIVLAGAVVSLLMPLVAIFASNCDIARPGRALRMMHASLIGVHRAAVEAGKAAGEVSDRLDLIPLTV
jgi:hypothetical protein